MLRINKEVGAGATPLRWGYIPTPSHKLGNILMSTLDTAREYKRLVNLSNIHEDIPKGMIAFIEKNTKVVPDEFVTMENSLYYLGRIIAERS